MDPLMSILMTMAMSWMILRLTMVILMEEIVQRGSLMVRMMNCMRQKVVSNLTIGDFQVQLNGLSFRSSVPMNRKGGWTFIITSNFYSKWIWQVKLHICPWPHLNLNPWRNLCKYLSSTHMHNSPNLLFIPVQWIPLELMCHLFKCCSMKRVNLWLTGSGHLLTMNRTLSSKIL